MNQKNKPRAYFSSPFIPSELVSACGFSPVSNMLAFEHVKSDNTLTGVCAFARTFANHAKQVCKHDVIIFTSICDQLRRISELVSPADNDNIFLFNMPATWQTEASFYLYKAELNRLTNFLCKKSNIIFEDKILANEIEKYNFQKEKLNSISQNFSADAKLKLAAHFHKHQTIDNFSKQVSTPSKPNSNKPRIAFIAGDLLPQESWIYKEIALAGAEISLDLSECSLQNLTKTFDLDLEKDSAFNSMSKFYFEAINDAFRRPDIKFRNKIESLIRTQKIAGVIIQHYVWCDIWQAQASALSKHLSIPVLNIDCDAESANNRQRLVTRIHAFIEMLHD